MRSAGIGQTAKAWREANLESLNSVMIEAGTAKEKRFEMLRKTAISQYQRLSLHGGLQGLEE